MAGRGEHTRSFRAGRLCRECTLLGWRLIRLNDMATCIQHQSLSLSKVIFVDPMTFANSWSMGQQEILQLCLLVFEIANLPGQVIVRGTVLTRHFFLLLVRRLLLCATFRSGDPVLLPLQGDVLALLLGTFTIGVTHVMVALLLAVLRSGVTCIRRIPCPLLIAELTVVLASGLLCL